MKMEINTFCNAVSFRELCIIYDEDKFSFFDFHLTPSSMACAQKTIGSIAHVKTGQMSQLILYLYWSPNIAHNGILANVWPWDVSTFSSFFNDGPICEMFNKGKAVLSCLTFISIWADSNSVFFVWSEYGFDVKRCERRINHGRKSYGERDHNRGFQTWLPLYSGQRIINSGGNIFKMLTRPFSSLWRTTMEKVQMQHFKRIFLKNFVCSCMRVCLVADHVTKITIPQRFPFCDEHCYQKWSFLGFKEILKGASKSFRSWESLPQELIPYCDVVHFEIWK